MTLINQQGFQQQYSFSKPSFQQQFGKMNTAGTLTSPKPNKSKQTAEIINASANGLDSVGNFVSLFLGGGQPTASTVEPPPQEQVPRKVSPWIWGGAGVGIILIIVLLMTSKNGKASQ